MSKMRVGINGMGRIGRTILRKWYQFNQNDFEVVAVNNPGARDAYSHLIKYDSVGGTFPDSVEIKDDSKLVLGPKTLEFFSIMDPSEIPWSDHNIDLVIDATGVFKDKAGLGKHLGGSVKKVIMCAPGKDLDGTFVVGINHTEYNNEQHNIVSNASCTTNCLAPVAKVLNDRFGIQDGFMTTVHSYTSDQNILDGSHADLKRARAAAISMIPTTTGAAKALGQVIPALKGKLDGYAVRVPTPNVSMVDLTVNLQTAATAEQVNQAMQEASEGHLKGVLGYCTIPLVSVDFVGAQESSVFDATLTNTIGNLVKVVSWYDNEMGFSSRVIDLAKYIGEQL